MWTSFAVAWLVVGIFARAWMWSVPFRFGMRVARMATAMVHATKRGHHGICSGCLVEGQVLAQRVQRRVEGHLEPESMSDVPPRPRLLVGLLLWPLEVRYGIALDRAFNNVLVGAFREEGVDVDARGAEGGRG